MSGPQVEDGYTRIANELMEQVPKFKLNGTQLRIILVIWRYTYGFKRKDGEFSLSFLAEALNTSRSQVDRELTALIERKVIEVVKEGGGGKPRILRFNKQYQEWLQERRPLISGQLKLVLENEDEMSAKTSTSLSSKMSTNKERKKNIKKGMSEMGIHKQVIDYLNAKAGKRFSHKSAANQKLINGRIAEGRTLEDFKYVIDVKVSHWKGDPKMDEYLRPSTLFAQRNFENYLNQKPKGGATTDDQRQQERYEEAFREWVRAGNDPEQFKFDD